MLNFKRLLTFLLALGFWFSQTAPVLAADAMFTINYYKVSAGHENAYLQSSVYPIGLADEEQTVLPITISGYTYQPNFNENGMVTVHTATINADGTTVFNLYYTPDDTELDYHANGGSGDMYATTGVVNQVVTVAANGFTRTGYHFSGWNTAADRSGMDYQTGGTYTLTPGTDILYAQWTEIVNLYTVIWYAADGQTVLRSEERTGPPYTTARVTEADKTAIKGYSYDTGHPSHVESGTISDTDDLELKLYLKPDVYQIRYELDGGVNHTFNPSRYTIEQTPFMLGNPTKSGYIFQGWTPDGGIPAGTTGELTFRATWRLAGESSPPTSGQITPEPKDDLDMPHTVDSDGTVTLKPTAAQLDKLLAAMPESGVLSMTVPHIEGMRSAVIELDLTRLTAHGGLKVLEFSVLDMDLSLPLGALESMRSLAETLRFGLAPGSVIFELTDRSGKDIGWYDYQNPVTVSMAYTAPMDLSTHQIVMTDQDGAIIPRSWYTWFTGTPVGLVSAKVYRAGTYDAQVSESGSFTDTEGLWMDEAVGYMAARGIVNDVGDRRFDSSGTITRAHFVTMLMRALDVEIDASTLESPYVDFADIPEWAQPHVITAKALGITLADEDNNFNPNAPITRQEMFFMASEAMGACGMLPAMFTEQWVIFSDWEGETGVKAEYSDAIQNLANLGLVKGNGDGTLNPSGTSTRAEGAQFLYNILRYDVT